MANRKDLSRTTPDGARRRAQKLFGDAWPDVHAAYRDLLAGGARREEDALHAAYLEAADLLDQARAQVAEARRRLVAAEARTQRYAGHADDWMTLIQPMNAAPTLTKLAGETARIATQVRAAGESQLRLWKTAPASGPPLNDLGPKRRADRKLPVRSERRPPLRDGHAGPFDTRRAWVAAARHLRPDLSTSAVAWALAGVGLGFDEPCPHDQAGDDRWTAIQDEWKKAHLPPRSK